MSRRQFPRTKEGKFAAALQPEKIGADLQSIRLKSTSSVWLRGGGQKADGTDAVVTDEVSGDGDGGAALKVVGHFVDPLVGVREELANAEEGVEGVHGLLKLHRRER